VKNELVDKIAARGTTEKLVSTSDAFRHFAKTVQEADGDYMQLARIFAPAGTSADHRPRTVIRVERSQKIQLPENRANRRTFSAARNARTVSPTHLYQTQWPKPNLAHGKC